jgi:hypothetical protein
MIEDNDLFWPCIPVEKGHDALMHIIEVVRVIFSNGRRGEPRGRQLRHSAGSQGERNVKQPPFDSKVAEEPDGECETKSD